MNQQQTIWVSIWQQMIDMALPEGEETRVPEEHPKVTSWGRLRVKPSSEELFMGRLWFGEGRT